VILRQPLIILEPPITFVGVGVPLICSLVAALGPPVAAHGPAIPLCPGSIAVLGLAIPVGRHLITTSCDLIA
jgi:hypothetical protein